MITRTREQLIAAINARNNAASTTISGSSSSSTSSNSSSSTSTTTNIDNEALLEAYNENFFIVPLRDPNAKTNIVAEQLDALIRDVFSGGFKYSGEDKLGIRGIISEEEFRELESNEEVIAFALQKRFQEMWSIVLLAHSQLPAYVLPNIIKFSQRSDEKMKVVSIDSPIDEERSIEIVAEVAGSTITCRYITRLERMPITHDNEIDPATNKKKIIGYIAGPMQTTHKLIEIPITVDGVDTSVWRYQLEKVESINPQVIQMFEGKKLSQLELPAYVAMLSEKHAALQLACNNYLSTLCHHIGSQITTHSSLEELRNSDRFPGLADAVQWCIQNTHDAALPNDHARVLAQYAAWFNENYNAYVQVKAVDEIYQKLIAYTSLSATPSNDELNTLYALIKQHPILQSLSEKYPTPQELIKWFKEVQLIEERSPNLARFAALAKHVTLVSELKEIINDNNLTLDKQIENFEKMLISKRLTLQDKPTASTKKFLEQIIKHIQKKNDVARIIEGINKTTNSSLTLFAAATTTTTPKKSGLPTPKKK